jgi:hypothetical protein
MMSFSSKYRTNENEIMDEFDLQGEPMKALLADLKRVNKWLGGNAVTLDGLERLLVNRPKNEAVTLLDIGCGDGEMLRQIARWAENKKRQVRLIGVDGNAHILKEAENHSEAIKNITFKQIDVFSEKEELPAFDIALCTLFLHHFKEPQIEELLHRLSKQATVGIVVNDLERSFWAFWLFKLFSSVFLTSKIARHDGLVSVARGFKKKELEQISEKIDTSHRIKWKWAFRFQWVLMKQN